MNGVQKLLTQFLPLMLCVCLAGCAGKQNAGDVPPVPLPPQEKQATTSEPAKAEPEKDSSKADPQIDGYDNETHDIIVDVPADLADH